MQRRHFLRSTFAATALGAVGNTTFGQEETFPPVRAVTKGPKFHWFGYYDKLEFDPTNRFILCNQLDFEGRPPTENDVLTVGMVDLQNGDEWIELGTSTAWSWQQGCMLQWVPGTTDTVIWNDRENGQYVSRILNVKTKEKRTLPLPVYSLSPDGKWAVTPDFARIDYCRSGYGYPGISDPCSSEKAPAKSGIWRMNLETGEHSLIFSLADAVGVKHPELDLNEKWNWFNHLLIAPDSKRLIFLHRWRDRVDVPRAEKAGGFTTRMFTINLDGTAPFILEPSGIVSHFIWRGADHLVAWARPETETEARVINYKDKTREYTKIGPDQIKIDGHMTFLPAPQDDWMLMDTYPDKVRRLQRAFLHNIKTDKQITLGQFFEPREYKGEFRCDLHPRASNDGKLVAFDSVHGGNGRQLHVIDIAKV